VRDKTTIDHLVRDVYEPKAPDEKHTEARPATSTGLTVEDQVPSAAPHREPADRALAAHRYELGPRRRRVVASHPRARSADRNDELHACFILSRFAISPIWTATMDIAPAYAGSARALMNAAGAAAVGIGGLAVAGS
jgi:hypothetical protein